MNIQTKLFNKRISSPIGIIIIAIAALLAGGILASQYLWVPKEIVQDETADWKTYTNEEYGFEIKYPKESVVWGGPEMPVDYFTYTISDIPIVNSGTDLKRKEFTISVINKSNSYPYSIFCVPGSQNENSPIDDKIYKFNNIEFRKRNYQEGTSQGWNEYKEYFAIRGDECFAITFRVTGASGTGLTHYTEEELEVFNKIISTFEFLE